MQRMRIFAVSDAATAVTALAACALPCCLAAPFWLPAPVSADPNISVRMLLPSKAGPIKPGRWFPHRPPSSRTGGRASAIPIWMSWSAGRSPTTSTFASSPRASVWPRPASTRRVPACCRRLTVGAGTDTLQSHRQSRSRRSTAPARSQLGAGYLGQSAQGRGCAAGRVQGIRGGLACRLSDPGVRSGTGYFQIRQFDEQIDQQRRAIAATGRYSISTRACSVRG